MTNIHLYVEHLSQAIQFSETNAALSSLLAFGQTKVLSDSPSLQSLLCLNCGINSHADCPIAAFTHTGDTGEGTQDYWLMATPVHLTLQRDFFSMTDTPTLSETESQALIANLNAHFAEDGYEFKVTSSQQWLLKVPSTRQLSSSPITQVIGRDTRPLMPKGVDAAWAAQLTNEIQMLLFEHPLNQSREARGELAVNSIWLWGAGILPKVTQPQTNKTFYADHPFVKGISQQTQLPVFTPPQSVNQLLSKLQPAQSNDAMVWIDLAQSNHDWFAEILQLLKKQKLKRIKLYFDLSGKVVELTLTNWDIWKFWRKRKPISAYLKN